MGLLEERLRHSSAAIHGGRFWEALGEDFSNVGQRRSIIPGDVLDAWFPPSPRVLEALALDPEWLCRTSPPSDAAGLVRAISQGRGIDEDRIAVGAGSSSLIFSVLPRLVLPGETCLVLDPAYGEYPHLLEKLGCKVERHVLSRTNGFELGAFDLITAIKKVRPSLVVLVNPNSPTGSFLQRDQVLQLIEGLPEGTRLWIDETYIDFCSSSESVESLDLPSNVFVLKSMSKAYGLSGLRVAYIVSSSEDTHRARLLSPPWAISLPAQLAAVAALGDSPYYEGMWAATNRLRLDLARAVRGLGIGEVFDGAANFVLVLLRDGLSTAEAVVERCIGQGVYLRDAASMGQSLGDRAIRISVHSAVENDRIVKVLGEACRGG